MEMGRETFTIAWKSGQEGQKKKKINSDPPLIKRGKGITLVGKTVLQRGYSIGWWSEREIALRLKETNKRKDREKLFSE